MTRDSNLELEPLGASGNESEKTILKSAAEDSPGARARAAVTARVLAEAAAQRRRTFERGAAVAGLVLAVAAALALVQRRVPEPTVTLAAEPRTSAAPSARAPSPPPSASGASPFAPCAPAVAGSGQIPLIDDFEDGDAHAPMVDNRAGQWITFNDGTGTQTPKAGVLLTAARIPGGRGASHFALHNFGSRFTKWGAVLSLELNPRHCYDASAYGGLEFWARGRGELRLMVKMNQVMAEEFGGGCAHDCYDGHFKTIKLTRDFTHVVVRWNELKQMGYGTPLNFDPHSIDAIDFGVRPEQTPFDFWIDDVSFSPR